MKILLDFNFVRASALRDGEKKKEMYTMKERNWVQAVDFSATSETLLQLFSGEIAGICIPEFLTAAECKELAERARQWEFGEYNNVSPPIGRFGITVFEYDRSCKADYFKAVEWANRNLSQIVQGTVNPVQRVMDWLSSLLPSSYVAKAFESGYGEYFAGLLRRIEEGTLIHVDFAPAEHQSWGVGQVVNQMAWNIYLDVPKIDPGLVHIWNKQWDRQDEVYKIPGSYGYLPEAVAGVSYAQIVPRPGMLMMINTRNFHQVLPSKGKRLAISAAVGCTADNKIILWS